MNATRLRRMNSCRYHSDLLAHQEVSVEISVASKFCRGHGNGSSPRHSIGRRRHCGKQPSVRRARWWIANVRFAESAQYKEHNQVRSGLTREGLELTADAFLRGLR